LELALRIAKTSSTMQLTPSAAMASWPIIRPWSCGKKPSLRIM
jgi:hypothetical protein